MTIHHKKPECQQVIAYCHGNIILLESNGKKPVALDWVSAESQVNGDAGDYLSIGYNVGFRIPPEALVIDVDPRNGGLESYAMLPQVVQDLPVTTLTPSGGFHVYTTLPPGVQYKELRTGVKSLPGIDFLHHGKQVVMPGSMLNEDLGWRVHPGAVIPPPEAPAELLELLAREAPAAPPVDFNSYLSIKELDGILASIPVTAYRDNETWLRLAMACHHATAGEGLPAFLAWSVADPEYADQGEIIARRWESMSNSNTPAPVTIRTLIKELASYGPVPTWLMQRAKMKATPEEFFAELDSRTLATATSMEDLAKEIDQTVDNIKLLTSIVAKIGMESTITESMREILIKKIATKTGASVASIRKDMRDLVTPNRQLEDAAREDTSTDAGMEQPHTMAAQTAIAVLSATGVPPAYCFNRWLQWDGRSWGRSTVDLEVKREAHKALYNQGTHATSGAVASVVEIMETLMAVSPRAFEPKVDDIIIHTPLKTLKFVGGEFVESVPSPDNRNLFTIGAHHRPNAPEPVLWLKYLSEVTTSEEARRTIACSIIYAAAQCRPWLRKAIYIYGPKRTGKSKALNLIQSLLGPDNVSALNMRQIGSKHGSFDLVGKLANISNETVSKDTIQDDTFKALISGEAIAVEEKFHQSQSHQNTAKLFFAANGFPKVNDESDATFDRLTIISFPNQISEDKDDPLLDEKLRTEMSGILNWAIKIFTEEYNKDKCVTAMGMDAAAKAVMNTWKETNNPAFRWVMERTVSNPQGVILLNAAYNDYRAWCHESGHRELNKIHFSRQVSQKLVHRRGPNGAVFDRCSLAPVQSDYFDILS